MGPETATRPRIPYRYTSAQTEHLRVPTFAHQGLLVRNPYPVWRIVDRRRFPRSVCMGPVVNSPMHSRTFPRITLAVVGVTSVAWSSAGSAAAAKPTTWWIETHPWTCSAEAGPLARQVQLACDATGRCAIASDERSADRRAVLVCGDEGWTLEARDASDQALWTLALGAADDEARLRKAGVWIARSEGEGPVDLPRPAMSTTTLSPAPATPSEAPERDRVPEDPGRSAHLSFAALFHGSSPRSDPNDYGLAWGGRVLLAGSAPRTTGPLLFGIAATAEGSSEKTDYSLVQGGVVLGLGASIGDFRLGVLVEGGPARLQTPGVLASDPGPFGPKYIASHPGTSAWLPYAQASLFVDWSRPGLIHPFLSPTATWLIDHGSLFPTAIPNEMVGLDIGLVWGQM